MASHADGKESEKNKPLDENVIAKLNSKASAANIPSPSSHQPITDAERLSPKDATARRGTVPREIHTMVRHSLPSSSTNGFKNSFGQIVGSPTSPASSLGSPTPKYQDRRPPPCVIREKYTPSLLSNYRKSSPEPLWKTIVTNEIREQIRLTKEASFLFRPKVAFGHSVKSDTPSKIGIKPARPLGEDDENGGDDSNVVREHSKGVRATSSVYGSIIKSDDVPEWKTAAAEFLKDQLAGRSSRKSGTFRNSVRSHTSAKNGNKLPEERSESAASSGQVTPKGTRTTSSIYGKIIKSDKAPEWKTAAEEFLKDQLAGRTAGSYSKPVAFGHSAKSNTPPKVSMKTMKDTTDDVTDPSMVTPKGVGTIKTPEWKIAAEEFIKEQLAGRVGSGNDKGVAFGHSVKSETPSSKARKVVKDESDDPFGFDVKSPNCVRTTSSPYGKIIKPDKAPEWKTAAEESLKDQLAGRNGSRHNKPAAFGRTLKSEPSGLIRNTASSKADNKTPERKIAADEFTKDQFAGPGNENDKSTSFGHSLKIDTPSSKTKQLPKNDANVVQSPNVACPKDVNVTDVKSFSDAPEVPTSAAALTQSTN